MGDLEEKNFLRFLGLYGTAVDKARTKDATPLAATRLVTPVNYGNTHWTVVCVDRTDPNSHTGSSRYAITLYNSMNGGADEYVLEELRGWIEEAHQKFDQNQNPTIKTRVGECTKQANCVDCGVFACRFAMHLLCREPVPVPDRNFNGNDGKDGEEGCSDTQFRKLIASMFFAERLHGPSASYGRDRSRRRVGRVASPKRKRKLGHTSYTSYTSYTSENENETGSEAETETGSETGSETETETRSENGRKERSGSKKAASAADERPKKQQHTAAVDLYLLQATGPTRAACPACPARPA
jgi:hypothetical protein